MNALTQPAINYNTGLIKAANSGDYSQLIQSASPQIGSIAQGAQQAEQTIRQSVPAGAGQQAALAQIPYQQAQQTSSALNSAYTSALGSLTQIGAAYGGVGLSEAGASTNASNSAQAGYGQVGQQQSESKATTMGFLGQLAGAAGTAIGGKCWVAEAIYGTTDPRTYLVRAYLNGPFSDGIFGASIMTLYGLIGRQVAWVLYRMPILKKAFKPLFDSALKSAILYNG